MNDKQVVALIAAILGMVPEVSGAQSDRECVEMARNLLNEANDQMTRYGTEAA